jgi:GNAT superfamily N-acetyltransferase
VLDVRLAPAAWDDADVRRLTAAQQAELRARYEGGQEPGTPPSAADVAVVLVARDAGGEAVGCGALRPLGDGVAEIKRMYAVPAARGRGLSKLVLAGLEAAARDPRLDDAAPGDRSASAGGHRAVRGRGLPADRCLRPLRGRRRRLAVLRAGARPGLIRLAISRREHRSCTDGAPRPVCGGVEP